MAAEDLNLFRVGTFSDAASHIKDKWYMVMLDLLPCICKKYTKVVRASEVLAAQITTGSDEALLLWCIFYKYKEEDLALPYTIYP